MAHAFFPNNGGDIHFDADEWWEVDVSLLNVAVHEIGHTLGLSHSNIYDSIMYGTYRPRNSIALDIDDKAGINAIYGKIFLLHQRFVSVGQLMGNLIKFLRTFI